jgi:hypothetical protein
MGGTGSGWPKPGVPRKQPRGHWLWVIPFLPQILWVYWTVAQVLELCVLVGHYRFFEMIVNTLEPI